MTATQKKVMEDYIATGRVAFFYPRKKLISLNGGKALPVKDAVARMAEVVRFNSGGK